MPPPVSRLYDAARAILDAVVAGYVADGADLPARRLVSIGPPSWDCELVAVWAERTFPYAGNVSGEVIEPHRVAPGHTMRGGLFRIQVVRCVPAIGDDDTPPTAEAEEAAAELLLADYQRVMNVLIEAERDGDLGVTCNDLAFVEWVSVGPSGGMAASTHGLRAGLGRA